jgi:hypothetical protein
LLRQQNVAAILGSLDRRKYLECFFSARTWIFHLHGGLQTVTEMRSVYDRIPPQWQRAMH